MSCICEKDEFTVTSSDSSLDDCDLMEEQVCNHCGRKYEARYRLISLKPKGRVVGFIVAGKKMGGMSKAESI